MTFAVLSEPKLSWDFFKQFDFNIRVVIIDFSTYTWYEILVSYCAIIFGIA